MFNILFVCMGNICRSQSTEGFFARQLQGSSYRELISIDSAGTHSYHVGHPPDPRAIEIAMQFDVQIHHLRARKVQISDFDDFDLILAMDRSNLEDLSAMQPGHSKAKLKLMMAYHPLWRSDSSAAGQYDEVPDPYYGGIDGFLHMFELLELATAGLLKDVEGRI